jgi:hypothetical protein
VGEAVTDQWRSGGAQIGTSLHIRLPNQYQIRTIAMSDNIVIDLLRAIRADIGELKVDMREVKERLGILEQQYASMSRRVDRIGGDVERIKTRLDLVDTAP